MASPSGTGGTERARLVRLRVFAAKRDPYPEEEWAFARRPDPPVAVPGPASESKREDSTWQIVHRPLFARRAEVLAEYGSKREAEQHLAGYKKKIGKDANVYVSEHLAPLSLDAYMDRGGR